VSYLCAALCDRLWPDPEREREAVVGESDRRIGTGSDSRFPSWPDSTVSVPFLGIRRLPVKRKELRYYYYLKLLNFTHELYQW
jgi:hypothetical protein